MSLSPIIVSAPPRTCCLVWSPHILFVFPSIRIIHLHPTLSAPSIASVHFYIFQQYNHSPLHQNRRCQPVIIFFYLVWAAPLRHKLSWNLILPAANCAVRRGEGRRSLAWDQGLVSVIILYQSSSSLFKIFC